MIFSHYWLSGLAALSLKLEWDIPVVHMFHTLALLKNKIARSDAEKDSKIRIEGEKKVLSGIDKVIVATKDERKQLVNLYDAKKKRIEIIPPGVDTTRFYPIPQDEAKEFVGMPHDEKMILFVGRIEPLKGIDNLIRAIAQLKGADVLSQCPHYLYIIGGDPNGENGDMSAEMAHLQALRDQLGISELVIFLGKKDQDSLQYYYSAAEMVIMPSHYESFGMVALEAMACGTPVIATQVGGLQHLVQDQLTGFTVPHGDPDALEEKITMLICKDGLRQQMSANTLKYTKKFRWEKIVRRLHKCFKSIIADYH